MNQPDQTALTAGQCAQATLQLMQTLKLEVAQMPVIAQIQQLQQQIMQMEGPVAVPAPVLEKEDADAG